MTEDKSLRHRRDVRTEDQFKQDIKDKTQRERMLIDLWKKEMEFRGHFVSYEDNGTDNSGEFTEKAVSKPDYKVTVDGKTELYEIKANKWSHKQTFKTYDLKEYIRYGASILLFYGLGHDSNNSYCYDTTRWGIISTQAMEWMLAAKEPSSGNPKWGNKQVIIIYPKEYEGYFTEERLTFNHPVEYGSSEETPF